MAHDAIEQSLSEHNRALEQQVRDLQAILGHLLASINETRDTAQANGAKIDRCMAAAASATARAELAIVKAQESVTAAAILERVADEDAKPRHAEPKPKRKLPPGWGGIVAGTAIALGVLKAHRAAAVAGAGALMVAASAPMATSLLPDADAHVRAPVAHHFHAHHDLDPMMGAVLPPRRRQHGSPVKSVHRRRSPSPKGPAPTGAATPPPSPVPSPTGTILPEPSPAATPPVPTPTVTPGAVLAWDH